MQKRALHSPNHRPREWRRKTSMPTLVRADGGWGSAAILNISSRGFMIQASRPTPKGSIVEVRHGGHIIMAKVVWRDGARAGLSTEARVPVEEILSADNGPSLQLTAFGTKVAATPPRLSNSHADNRIRGRVMEFVSIGLIVLVLAAGAVMLVVDTLQAPMARISAAL